jgi:hypothetical protein
MRFSISRAGLSFVGAALALAACSSHGMVPSSSGAFAPAPGNTVSNEATLDAKKHATTCATSPPQYQWIFKGSCDPFTLKDTGGSFSLAKYENITLTGSIGKNTVKGSATIALADAIDKGDITKYTGKAFPAYKAAGTTVVYAVANNESTQTIKAIAVKNKTVLQYTVTDAKGLPGNTCGAALLGETKQGLKWTSFPGTGTVKNDSVTISVYEAPSGFELPPKGTALYFAFNCYQG